MKKAILFFIFLIGILRSAEQLTDRIIINLISKDRKTSNPYSLEKKYLPLLPTIEDVLKDFPGMPSNNLYAESISPEAWEFIFNNRQDLLEVSQDKKSLDTVLENLPYKTPNKEFFIHKDLKKAFDYLGNHVISKKIESYLQDNAKKYFESQKSKRFTLLEKRNLLKFLDKPQDVIRTYEEKNPLLNLPEYKAAFTDFLLSKMPRVTVIGKDRLNALLAFLKTTQTINFPDVISASFSPDKKRVAVAHQENLLINLLIYDTKNYKEIKRWSDVNINIRASAFNTDANKIYAFTYKPQIGHSIMEFDVETGEMISLVKIPDSTCKKIQVSPDDKYVCVLTSVVSDNKVSHRLLFIDIQQKKIIATIEAPRVEDFYFVNNQAIIASRLVGGSSYADSFLTFNFLEEKPSFKVEKVFNTPKDFFIKFIYLPSKSLCAVLTRSSMRVYSLPDFIEKNIPLSLELPDFSKRYITFATDYSIAYGSQEYTLRGEGGYPYAAATFGILNMKSHQFTSIYFQTALGPILTFMADQEKLHFIFENGIWVFDLSIPFSWQQLLFLAAVFLYKEENKRPFAIFHAEIDAIFQTFTERQQELLQAMGLISVSTEHLSKKQKREIKEFEEEFLKDESEESDQEMQVRGPEGKEELPPDN